MNRIAVIVTAALVVCLASACSPAQATPAPTTQPARATVTDLSVPFDTSESDALVARGFLGNGSLGRLGSGCTVELLKTTDRAARVKILECPASANTPNPPPAGSQGWVAKSALNIY